MSCINHCAIDCQQGRMCPYRVSREKVAVKECDQYRGTAGAWLARILAFKAVERPSSNPSSQTNQHATGNPF